MIDKMGPSEIGVLGAVSIFIIDRLLKMIREIMPKTINYSEADIKEMEYKTNLKSLVQDMKAILIKLSDKGDQREKILDDIKVTGDNSHKRIGQIESHLDVFKRVLAKD